MTSFTLKLSDYTFRKLIEAAGAAGVAPGRMAGMMLEAWVRDEVGPALNAAPTGVNERARDWAGAASLGPDRHPTPDDRHDPVVELAEPVRSRFSGMAQDSGIPQEMLAAEVLESRLFDYDDFEWPEGGDPREDNAANYDLNEVGRPWSEVRPEMVALLERKLAERK